MLQAPVIDGIRKAARDKADRARAVNKFANPERYGELSLFTRWTAGPLVAQALIDTEGVGPAENHLVRGEEVEEDCWWIVDVCGKEIVSTRLAIVSPCATPLLRNQIAATGVRTSRLRARVSWMKSGLGCEIDLDIGSGFRIAIEGANVHVYVLVPKNESTEARVLETLPLAPIAAPPSSTLPNQSVPIPNVTPPEICEDATILDSVITGQVLKCTSTNSDRTASLTQTFERPALDAEFAIEIPPRAQTLSVSMPAPGLLTPLQFRLGSLVTSPIIKTVFFDTILLVRSTPVVEIPQNATHITLGAADPVNARRWTLIWGLEF